VPAAGLVAVDGTLYGTTEDGGGTPFDNLIVLWASSDPFAELVDATLNVVDEGTIADERNGRRAPGQKRYTKRARYRSQLPAVRSSIVLPMPGSPRTTAAGLAFESA
jgi:hypothetical protein